MPAVGYGRLSPAAHRAKRELYLQLLAEVRRGVPHSQLRTGEELTDDHDHYLVEQPALLGQGDLEEFPWAGGSAQSPEDRDGQLGMSVAGVNPSKLGGRGDTHQERSHKAGTTSQEM